MTAILHTTREQWLKRRAEMITASDVGAILGLDPRRAAFSVYVAKVTGEDGVEHPWMAKGRRWEPIIAEEYVALMGRRVIEVPPFEIVVHPDLKWFGSTLDRRTVTEDGAVVPLELKRVGRAHRAEWDDGQTPLYYETQVQSQIACEGSSVGALCALTSLDDDPEVRDLPRNDRFLQAAIPKLEEFWWRCQRRQPPPIDITPSAGPAIRRLWPAADGTEVELVEAEPDVLEIVDEWEAAKDERGQAEKVVEAMGNRLRAAIGPAAIGLLPDGSWLKYVVEPRTGYTVEPSRPRVLRHQKPKSMRRK